MQITFVRHGQTAFNAAWLAGAPRPTMPDPELTAVGRDQARQLKEWLSNQQFDIALTSPYSRALETAQVCGLGPILRVMPQLREAVVHECDVGSAPEILRARFPALDFSAVAECWWAAEDTMAERIRELWSVLRELGDQRVVIIGHRGYFIQMLGIGLENCEVTNLQWDPDDADSALPGAGNIIWRPDPSSYTGISAE